MSMIRTMTPTLHPSLHPFVMRQVPLVIKALRSGVVGLPLHGSQVHGHDLRRYHGSGV